jgi:hypothetical protein
MNAYEKISDDETPPFHVLMLGTSSDNETTYELNNQKSKMLILNRRFKNDYLSMRYRAFQDAKPTKVNNNDPTTTTTATNTTTATSAALQQQLDDSVNDLEKWWSGASTVERALASCCTLHPDDYWLSGEPLPQNNNSSRNSSSHSTRRQLQQSPANDIEEDMVAGALAIEKITKFIGILALRCHDKRMKVP